MTILANCKFIFTFLDYFKAVAFSSVSNRGERLRFPRISFDGTLFDPSANEVRAQIVLDRQLQTGTRVWGPSEAWSSQKQLLGQHMMKQCSSICSSQS